MASVELPKLNPLPPLSKAITRAKNDKSQLVTATRVLVSHLTTADTPIVLLRWEGAGDGPIGADHALAKKPIELSAVQAKMTAQIAGPDVKSKQSVPNQSAGKPEPEVLLTQAPNLVMAIAPSAFSTSRWGLDATKRTEGGPVFSSPGKYTITVTGQLAPSDPDTIGFESAPFTIDVSAASPTNRPLAELREIAAKTVATKFALKTPPESRREIVEDTSGNRVIRFSLHDDLGRYEVTFVEVVVSPAGEVLSIDTRKIFTCIAVGTAIDTPEGPRAIESLHEGDAVWGFDPRTRERVITHVRASVRSHADRVIALSSSLRVTPRHPVMIASGQFVEAGQLSAQSEIVFGDGHVASPMISESSPTDVIELSVDEPHTYIAAGVVVHNKAVATPESMLTVRDSWESIDFRPSSPAPKR